MANERAVIDGQRFNEPPAPIVVAAAGATQGGATLIPQTAHAQRVMVSVTASSQGVKLPTPLAVGHEVVVFSPIAKGCKVYPQTNGKIGSAATNAAVSQVLNKANIYVAESPTTWRLLAGA